MLQIHEQESSDIHGGDELKYFYTINENNIIESMRRTNTVIAGKETKAKLTGKAFVNFWNYLSIITGVKQVGKEYGMKAC